jgi:hypothetical protein
VVMLKVLKENFVSCFALSRIHLIEFTLRFYLVEASQLVWPKKKKKEPVGMLRLNSHFRYHSVIFLIELCSRCE